MLGDGFGLFVYIASGYELFVCVDDCASDDVSLLLYIVRWGMVTKLLVNPVSIVSP